MDKRGVAEIISYVLLIAMVVVMGAIVYGFLSTYIPKNALECSDGVSVYVNSYVYKCDVRTINLDLKNNGRFDIAGYFIHGANSTAIELPTIDLSAYTTGIIQDGAILFSSAQNANNLKAKRDDNRLFALSSGLGNITSVEIIPIRYEEIDGKTRLLSCTNAKIKVPLTCYNGIAQLSASYSNICKNCGSRPPGANLGDNWWYFDTKLSETGGITGLNVNTRQKCTQSQALGYLCDANKTDIAAKFGTNHINAGNSIYWNGNYIYTSSSSMNATETYWGTDDNSNGVSASYTFSVS